MGKTIVNGVNYAEKWTKEAKKNLVGSKIIKVEYMPKEELEEMMWYKSPLCMLMQRPNGTKFWMYPSADDEGNDGGAIFTTIKSYSCAPTLNLDLLHYPLKK